MHHQLERSIPIGYTFHNPSGISCRLMSATSRTVRMLILADKPAYLDVDLPARTATIRLTTEKPRA